MRFRLVISMVLCLIVAAGFAFSGSGFAVDELQSYVETVQQAESGMTLWQVLQSGGIVMVILAGISILMFSLVNVLYMTLDVEKLLPDEFSHTAIDDIRKGKLDHVRRVCTQSDNMMSRIILAGLSRVSKGAEVTKEAVEIEARKEVTGLWNQLSYLSDIAAVAPMLGLLGTVIGMIQAFNTIAFQSAVVKPILLAGGVSKAMVTTAGGMTIAIIAMVFYSYFRFRVQNITGTAETLTAEVMAAFASPKAAGETGRS
ncbi:MAG: MotA/TolQ/ExbB proton channel family protein [Candidatus Omnitrophota bacterium]|nr:MotA/TolQ/ExbB proton channel family protein [Candidatus Omnitrophota bacterium]